MNRVCKLCHKLPRNLHVCELRHELRVCELCVCLVMSKGVPASSQGLTRSRLDGTAVKA